MNHSSILILLTFSLVLSGCPTAVRQGPLRSGATPESQNRSGGNAPWGGLEEGLRAYRWVQDRPNQSPGLSLVVAISGGGYRAAAFALGALMQMEKVSLSYPGESTPRNLFSEVDYITTVSGGGFAGAGVASYYLSRNHHGTFNEYILASDLHKVLTQWIDARLIASGINPWPLSATRGDRIQDYLDSTVFSGGCEAARCPAGQSSWQGTLSLSNVFVDKDAVVPPTSPYWIANATIYNNGDSLSFHPHSLEKLGVASYWQNGRRRITEAESPKEFYARTPLALGMRASMSFPVVFPPVELQIASNKQGDTSLESVYLLDGGTSDNLALFSAMEIMRFERSKAHEERKCERQVLIIIDAFNGSSSPIGEASPPSSAEVLLDSLSNYHALAAHRQRTQRDLNTRDDRAFTVIEGAVRDGDVAVFYLDLDEESVARRTDTNLHATEATLAALFTAGRNQVCAKLGGSDCVAERSTSGTAFARTTKMRRRTDMVKKIDGGLRTLCEAVADLKSDWRNDLWRVVAAAGRSYLEAKVEVSAGAPIAFEARHLKPVTSLLDLRIAKAQSIVRELKGMESEPPNAAKGEADESVGEGGGELDESNNVDAVRTIDWIKLRRGLAEQVVEQLTSAREMVVSQEGNVRFSRRQSVSRQRVERARESSVQFIKLDEGGWKWRELGEGLISDAELAAFDEAWRNANELRGESAELMAARSGAAAVGFFARETAADPSVVCSNDLPRNLDSVEESCAAVQEKLSKFSSRLPPTESAVFEEERLLLRRLRGNMEVLCGRVDGLADANPVDCEWDAVEQFAAEESAELRDTYASRVASLRETCAGLDDRLGDAMAVWPDPTQRETVDIVKWAQTPTECW